jgi:HK97 gp10 family phage protein
MAKLVWLGDDVEASVRDASVEAIDETNTAAAAQAKGAAPVRSGEHRDSIEVQPALIEGDQVTGSWGANAKHSPFVELGTSKMAAQPHLRPAADAENRKLAGRIRDRLK